MSRVVWIGHYIEESDVFHFNNVRLKARLARELYRQVNGLRRPYVFAEFASQDRQIEFYGIVCPMLPAAVASLGHKKQLEVMKKALALANSLNADQISIAALFASIWEDGDGLKELTRAPITTGKNLIAALVIDCIERAGRILGRDTGNSTIGIVGSRNRIAGIFIEEFASKAASILLDCDDERSGAKGNMRRASHEEIFSRADIIIVTTMGLGLAGYTGLLKPGAVVCDIVVPYHLTKEIRKIRSDVFAFEGVWSKYERLSDYTGADIARLFPGNVMPACVAEPIILALEDCMSYFSLGGNITYANMRLINEKRLRDGFQFFGFKQGNGIYSGESLESLKKSVNTREAACAV